MRAITGLDCEEYIEKLVDSNAYRWIVTHAHVRMFSFGSA